MIYGKSGKASSSVLRPALLYISSQAVIPAKAGIQIENTGFRVKPGMTIKAKGLLTQYNRFNKRVGWIHADLDRSRKPDVIADLRQDLPFKSRSIDYIHSEDFVQ
jgi:hypothetical protein